jgi:hypothetical protein
MVFLAPGARAQGMIGGGNPIVGEGKATTSSTLPPPPALPGSHVKADNVAPPTRPPSDLDPNEALFDAINRGDITTVRDAISRGADLSSENVLGLTPLDLSVDLGRNEITFLLLSLRAGSSSAGTKAAAAKPDKAAPPPAAPAPVAVARPAPRPAPAPVRRQVAAEQPPLPPSGPGVPVPQAGFLGFGGPARP